MKTYQIPFPLARVPSAQLDLAFQMLEVHIQSPFGLSTLCLYCGYPDLMQKMKDTAFGYDWISDSFQEHIKAVFALIKHCIPFPAQFIAKFHLHQFSIEILLAHKVALDNLEDDVEAWTSNEITMQLLASLTAAGAVLLANKVTTGHAQYLKDYIYATQTWPKSRAQEPELPFEPCLDDQSAAVAEVNAVRAEIQSEGER